MSDLEARVERLEKWARRPGWLDEPAEINGEPVVMSDTFPIEAKIFGAVVALGLLGCGVMTLVGAIHYSLTGQPL